MHMEQWLRLGANLIQSGFTDWCPMMVVLRAAGVKGKSVKI